MQKISLKTRTFSHAASLKLMGEKVHPLLAKVLASRNVDSMRKLDTDLSRLLPVTALKGAVEAASYLADCIEAKKKIVIIADYDCDGATACAVGFRGLKALGADIQYVVPDRMVHGYGLTPGVVDVSLERFPEANVLVTVDNGIASHSGVAHAYDRGLEVVVTDHHLPVTGRALPMAHAIVDPVQPGCTFPSKALAGVGVIWYVIWALQVEQRKRGIAPALEGFRASSLLPLVAVGTVADVVPLDENNRLIVAAGLERIRAGHSFPGLDALATVGFNNRTRLSELLTSDIAFGIGPRINAAGRLKTMDIGIDCLTTDDPAKAKELAIELATINQTRKAIEGDTVKEAVQQAEALIEEGTQTISVFSPKWHAGVIGIVAGRIKEKRYRPTFVLTADPDTGEIKGSGRSIPGLNLKDVLDQVDKRVEGLLLRFGGHAMAAGVTIRPGGFEAFREAFEAEANKVLTDDILSQVVEVDGSLSGVHLNQETAKTLNIPPWGQMFPAPTFVDTFQVLESKIGGVRKDQLTMLLEREGVEVKAVRFRHEGPAPEKDSFISVVYNIQRGFNKFGKPEISLLLGAIL